MKLKIPLYILFLICYISVNGQDYKEVKFINIEPVWIHSPIDSTLVDDNNSGRDNFANLSETLIPHCIKDNYLYIAHHIFSWTKEVEGAILEKINLSNGNIEWANKWSLEDNDRQEWVESIFIDEEGYLNVITDKRIAEPFVDMFSSFSYFGDTSLLSIRKFDVDNGDLIEHLAPDAVDDQSFRIKSGVWANTILYPVSNTEFQYYEYNHRGETISLNTIDQNGHTVSDAIIDTIQFFDGVNVSDEGVTHVTDMVKVNRDTLVTLSVIIGEPGYDIDTQTMVTVYDEEMNIVNKFRIDSFLQFKYKNIFLRYATHDFIHIYGRSVRKNNRDTNFYMIMNYDGDIERRFVGVYNGRNHSIGFPMFLEKEKEYLGTCFNSDYYGLDFVLTNSSDSVTLLKELYFQDSDAAYYTNYIKQLDNGDILAIGSTSYYNIDYGRYEFICPTIMRLKAEDLGIQQTSTIEISKSREELLLSPNPVKYRLQIDSKDMLIEKVFVYDVLGSLIFMEEFAPNETQHINLEHLIKGIYVVKAYDGKNKYKIGKFIKQ